MTDLALASDAVPTDGTGAGMMAWFTWMVRTREVSDSNASSLRTGVRNVLTITPGWEDVDVTAIDVDRQLQRFRSAKRGSLSERSVEEYVRRFRQSIDSYRRWLDGEQDWNPVRVRAIGVQPRRTAPRRDPVVEPMLEQLVDEELDLVRHVVPLRSGGDAVLYLPRDLSPADARRIGGVAASLAMDDDDEDDEDRRPYRSSARKR